MEPTYCAKYWGDANVCGSLETGLETSSWSRKSAPGICNAAYSAWALRFCAGRYHEASMMVSPGVPSRFSSQSASTMKGLSSAIFLLLPASCDFVRLVPSIRRHRPEADAEAPIFATLLLDLADVDLADFAGAPHMGAAAWLAVDRGILTNADQADPAGADGRPHVLRLHQAGIGGQFLVGDQPGEDRMVGTHQLHQPGRDVLLGEAGIGNVEVDTAVVLGDRRSRDRKRTDDGKQMAGGVHAHQKIPPLPIDGELQLFADRRQALFRRRHVDDLVLGLAGDGCGDRDAAAVGAVAPAVI